MWREATGKVVFSRRLERAFDCIFGIKTKIVMGAFAEMSGDVSRICDIIAHELASTHVSYYNDDAKRTKGMYRRRIQKAWGHTAHRGWARLLLDRARDLIIHGPAQRGANGGAMPTDEDDQDGHFFFNHPERGGHCAAA